MHLRTQRFLALFLLPFIGVLACNSRKAELNQQQTGLGASAEPQSEKRGLVGGIVGGRPEAIMPDKVSTFLAPTASSVPPAADRKIVRTGSLELVVDNVPQSLERLHQEAERLGGFIENSSLSGDTNSATLNVRVPAHQLDEAIGVFKKNAMRVDRETLRAEDVTHQYIDLDARLRNARAEEAQYLQIMKRAVSVKDTLEVAEKLADVRGRIEQMQGEMRYMTQQIDMSALQISLATDAYTQVLGIHWRPLVRARAEFYAMLEGMVDWSNWIISLIIDLPLILLWIATIGVLALVAWRLLRTAWRFISGRTGWKLPSLRLRNSKPDAAS